MITETFGKDYAIFLQYLAPDYGRVILDLENSDTGNVLYHSSMRFAGCTHGIYRESNVLIMNSFLDSKWGYVERPKGFPFQNSSEKISITVTATEANYKFYVQSGMSTFKHYYKYRPGTDPEKVNRINSYILEYRQCPPLRKGEVLNYGFGKQVNDFRDGTVIAIHGIAPANDGQMVNISIVGEVPNNIENPRIVNVSVLSGREINTGEKFIITIRIKHDSIYLSANGGLFHEHMFDQGKRIDTISLLATVWISGINHLIRIDAI